MGYHRAGFDVVGVDIEPQPNYPFEFHSADVMDVLDPHMGSATYVPESLELGRFDAIHASPPCQGYSRMRHLPWLRNREYQLLIEPVRERLVGSGVPWVIENVEDAPLERAASLFGIHGVLLCGTMFGLPIYRHRPFESSVNMIQPEHPRHSFVISPGRMLGGRADVRRGVTAWQEGGGVGGHMGGVDRARQAMGIDWMPAAALSQAIPPAYTEYVGKQLMDALVNPRLVR